VPRYFVIAILSNDIQIKEYPPAEYQNTMGGMGNWLKKQAFQKYLKTLVGCHAPCGNWDLLPGFFSWFALCV
jgi:Holliday junction resolvasome RuvABC endonuclease subunit